MKLRATATCTFILQAGTNNDLAGSGGYTSIGTDQWLSAVYLIEQEATMHRTLGLVVALVLLVGCSQSTSAPITLHQPLYVLSGYNVGNGFRDNALTIIDRSSPLVQHEIPLPRSWAKHLNLDPLGRVWIGFSGNMQHSDKRVQVYGPTGKLVRELEPCTDAEAGISFARGRAFIACAENGHAGKIAVVNLETLELETTIDVQAPGGPLMLTASGANDAAVVVVGLTTGVGEGTYAVITLLDPQTLAVRAQLPPRAQTDIWQILPADDRFYLLNVAGQTSNDGDLLELTIGATPTITPHSVADGQLWGAIEGDVVYSYHNRSWNQPRSDVERYVSKLDLRTGASQVWQLPDNWDAADLAVVDGEVLLARWDVIEDQAAGVYKFDQAHGELQLVHTVADASSLLGP